MTGQGETVQLFNRVGTAGFRGLEGWDRPPFSLDLCEKSLLTSLLPVEPLGRGRGPIDLGSRCSRLCLLWGCMSSEFSVSSPLCLASSGQCFSCPCPGASLQVQRMLSPHTQLRKAFLWLENGCPSSYTSEMPSDQVHEFPGVSQNLLW